MSRIIVLHYYFIITQKLWLYYLIIQDTCKLLAGGGASVKVVAGWTKHGQDGEEIRPKLFFTQ